MSKKLTEYLKKNYYLKKNKKIIKNNIEDFMEENNEEILSKHLENIPIWTNNGWTEIQGNLTDLTQKQPTTPQKQPTTPQKQPTTPQKQPTTPPRNSQNQQTKTIYRNKFGKIIKPQEEEQEEQERKKIKKQKEQEQEIKQIYSKQEEIKQINSKPSIEDQPLAVYDDNLLLNNEQKELSRWVLLIN